MPADGGIPGGQVQACRRDQEPVETDDFQSRVKSLLAELMTLAGAHLLDRVRSVEGSDLDAIEARLGDRGDRFAQGGAENFAAESVLESHRGNYS